MFFRCLLLVSMFFLSAYCHGKRTLVLLDNMSIKDSHKMFFTKLSDLGHSLVIKMADDPSLYLSKYKEYIYDNIVLFAPRVEEFGGGLSLQAIVKFIDQGGNLIVAGSSQTTDLLRDICSEIGLELDEKGSYVIDHSSYHVADTYKNTLVISDTSNLVKAASIVGKKLASESTNAGFLYQGTGILLRKNNNLVIPVLTASQNAYTYNPEKKITTYPHAVGNSTVLLAGLQARNNARVIFSGSLDFFSDKFFSMDIQTNDGRVLSSGNSDLATSLAQWAFMDCGVLRVGNVSHHLHGQMTTPSAYTIKDFVDYSIEIEELVDGVWQPFASNDVQLEFIRIDPFVRLYLRPLEGTSEHRVTFQLPDVYGVFQFRVEYVRLGYSRLYSSLQVPVRPFQHTQYERFIASAYPYYASAFSMMFSCLLFSFIFIHYREPSKNKKE